MARGLSRAPARRNSLSCSCTATAPTATISSTSAAPGSNTCRKRHSCRRMRRSRADKRRSGGNGSRSPFAIRTNAGSASTRQRPLLERFLDAELNRHKLPPSALALVGFSQGTMMALHVGLRRAVPPAAIVGYSGPLVVPPDGEPKPSPPRSKSRPAGAAGSWRPRRSHPAAGPVPGDAGPRRARRCRSNGIYRAGIGHGIDAEGLRHGGEFLARRFGIRS